MLFPICPDRHGRAHHRLAEHAAAAAEHRAHHVAHQKRHETEPAALLLLGAALRRVGATGARAVFLFAQLPGFIAGGGFQVFLFSRRELGPAIVGGEPQPVTLGRGDAAFHVGEGLRIHLVILAGGQRHQRQGQRVGAVGAAQGVPGLAESGQVGLELADLRAHDPGAADDGLLDGGLNLAAEAQCLVQLN